MTAPARLTAAIALGLALAACSWALSSGATPGEAATLLAATTTVPAAATPGAPTTTPTAPTTRITGDAETIVRTRASSGNSGAAIAIIAIVCVLALGLLAWEAARWWAYEPRSALRLRHALAEAGLRCAETWSELLDWARGR